MLRNNKFKWAVFTFCFGAFVIVVGWTSSYITKRVNNAKAEQQVEDTVQSHTFWIEELKGDVTEIQKDTSSIKETLGRHDERLKTLEKGFDNINGKLDRIWDKVK